MSNRLDFVFGAVRHMVRIGDSNEHRALRERNEQRLAALKAAKTNYETPEIKNERARANAEYFNAVRNSTAEERAQYLGAYSNASSVSVDTSPCTFDLVDGTRPSTFERGENAGVWTGGRWEDGPLRNSPAANCLYK